MMPRWAALVLLLFLHEKKSCSGLEIDWPPAESRHEATEVPLRFGVTTSEARTSVCIRILEGDGRWATLACEALAVLAREQVVLRELLPGRRTVRVSLYDEAGKEVESATTSFVVGASVGVDLAAATWDDRQNPWEAAVPRAANDSERRSLYFGAVYDTRYWSARGAMRGVPASGPGSSLDAARNAVRAVEDVVRDFDVRLVVDAPCGDLHWMKTVDLGKKARYVGADVVDDLLRKHRDAFTDRAFVRIDLADAATAPAALAEILESGFENNNNTLVLCRHLLFHLPPEDGVRVLATLVASGARWLLTSTYLRAADLESPFVLANGHRVNLFRAPFSAPDPARLYKDAGDDQYLGLWDLESWRRLL